MLPSGWSRLLITRYTLIFSFRNEKSAFKQNWKIFPKQITIFAFLETWISMLGRLLAEVPSGNCTALDSLLCNLATPLNAPSQPEPIEMKWESNSVRCPREARKPWRHTTNDDGWKKVQENTPFLPSNHQELPSGSADPRECGVLRLMGNTIFGISDVCTQQVRQFPRFRAAYYDGFIYLPRRKVNTRAFPIIVYVPSWKKIFRASLGNWEICAKWLSLWRNKGSFLIHQNGHGFLGRF